MYIPPPKPTLQEIVETKKLKETRSIEAYRIYGHFALCCLAAFSIYKMIFLFSLAKNAVK